MLPLINACEGMGGGAGEGEEGPAAVYAWSTPKPPGAGLCSYPALTPNLIVGGRSQLELPFMIRVVVGKAPRTVAGAHPRPTPWCLVPSLWWGSPGDGQ